MLEILNNQTALISHIARVLNERSDAAKIYIDNELNPQTSAGVLLLLGPGHNNTHQSDEPCLILNKRSVKVRQPGDLCFPGGSITPRIDSLLAKLFSLPITSLGRWPYWLQWKHDHPAEAGSLALLWATGLRESLEEMRLNPFGAKFLGPLPPQNLVMFQRKIYPVVAWISRQKRFFPNWEVEKIIYIPLRKLVDPANYWCYRLTVKFSGDDDASKSTRDYPCFRIKTKNGIEILWGATFNITTVFMEYIFGFKPPGLENLPVVEGTLDQNYLMVQK
ncbi:MAG: CoA pyrophosphatase [bacterium]|nr:CoA pyrophosphatase [bacterium]